MSSKPWALGAVAGQGPQVAETGDDEKLKMSPHRALFYGSHQNLGGGGMP